MSRNAKTSVLVAAALLAAGAFPGAACADTVQLSGQVKAKVPENDLTDVSVVNGDDALRARIRLTGLRDGRRVVVQLVYAPRGATYPFVAVARRTAAGEIKNSLWVSDGGSGVTDRLPCPKLTSAWVPERRTVRIRVPQRCFPDNATTARVKVMAGFFNPVGDGDYTTFRRVAQGPGTFGA